MTLEDFIRTLDSVKPKSLKGGPGYVGLCPSCAIQGKDATRSNFSIYEGDDGWLHVKCQAGCSEDDILRARGVERNECRVVAWEPPHKNGKSNGHYVKPTVYEYTDEKGNYLFEKVRLIGEDGKKTFFQKDKRTDKKGVGHLGPASKTLYNLPEVLAAKRAGRTIYLNEGEKACELLAVLGEVGTCQPAGAGPGKWLPMHTELLRGADIVQVADRDSVGEEYAKECAIELRSVCRSYRLVQSATEKEHDDLFDHLEAENTLEQLVERKDLMPPRGFLDIVPIASYEIQDATFLFGTHFRRAQINILDGDGGTGKSTVMLALAASASRGFDPIAKKKIRPFRTLYIGHEDDGGDYRYIFESCEGSVDFLMHKPNPFSLTPANLQLLKETIIDGDYEMVVLDVLAYFLEGIAKDLNNSQDLIKPLAGLRSVAMETGCGIVNLRHTGKGKDGKPISELGIGSVQIRNSHRSQLVMQWHPDRKSHYDTRVISHEKGSIRVKRGDPFGWNYDSDVFGWVDINPDVFEKEVGDAIGKRDLCEKWMVSNLTGQYVKSSVVYETLQAYGISRRTIDSTCQKLEVTAIKDGTGAWLKHIEKVDPFGE